MPKANKQVGMKVLELDIETAPHRVFAWGLFKQNIYIDSVVAPGYTLCFAAKWQHSKRIIFKSLYANTKKAMLNEAWDLLDEADVVVHYNGKRFDIPTLNKEFVLNGMVPPTNYKQIDLYHVVRSNFRFASNKLDFVSEQLGLGKKLAHKGMTLWRDCMDALNYKKKEHVPVKMKQSWKTMETYNIQDVKLLGSLYDVLQPWIKSHPNRALYLGDASTPTCPNCGGHKLVKKGVERPAKINAYQRYKCKTCGSNSRSRLPLTDQVKPTVV
jgi:DNA polymerase elongation subunit (family B)